MRDVPEYNTSASSGLIRTWQKYCKIMMFHHNSAIAILEKLMPNPVFVIKAAQNHLELRSKGGYVVKIAVVENKDKKTSSILEPGYIAIYDDKSGEWCVCSRFENIVYRAGSIAELRITLEDTIKRFDGAIIVVAREIPGLALCIIQDAGFGVSIIDGSAIDILDLIRKELLQVIKNQQGEAQEADIMNFLEQGMDRGNFNFDMKDALSANSKLTSKGLLLPYLENGEFNRLDVICSHIPPWFDRNLADLGLEYETLEVLQDKVTVKIIHTIAK